MFAASILVACGGGDDAPETDTTTSAGDAGSAADTRAASETDSDSRPRTAGYNTLRNPYFGQTHQHTGWSFDAAIYDVRLGPDNAYRHARGEKVSHPAGYEVQLKIPLDFMVVSDHAEYLGAIVRMYDPGDPLSTHRLANQIVESGTDVAKSTQAFYELVAQTIQPDGSTKPDPMLDAPDLKRTIWQEYVEIANRYYLPGRFTTLVGYEWSAQPNMSNLHRNVIFRDSDKLPEVPFSYFDSQYPEDLWKWMDQQRATGSTLLAIPHNGNLSNGLMFALEDSTGKALTREYAERRMRNEPLTEIVQTKGQSETHPNMSPYDEFAGFEIWTKPVAGPGTVKVVETSYVRNAFMNGLTLEQEIGINPFRYGVVGGGDIHTSIVSHEEYAYTGEHNLKSGTPEQRLLESTPGEPSKIEQGTAGLSNVWAEENTRESIYDALARRESWATSGPRMTVRVFGGFEFDDTTPADENWVQIGYEHGAPMGGNLPSADDDSDAPRFMIRAQKGPNSGNLDRVQVIKGWLDATGNTHEKIYNVAWSGDRQAGADGRLPPVGNTVDIERARYSNSIGATELQTVWTDPAFDVGQPAFYYLRVLEIPTPRWSTDDAAELGIAPPAGFPAVIQERAWTSPIWYRPTPDE